MRCAKCGCELPENSKFCFSCGAKLEENDLTDQQAGMQEQTEWQNEAEDETVLLSAGEEDETVLLSAGVREYQPEQEKSEAGTEQEESGTDTEQEAGKYCPYCGSRNDADAVFCSGCGKNMNMEETVSGGNAGGHGTKKGNLKAGKIIGVAAAAVIVVGGIALLMNAFGDDTLTKVAYLKDGKVMQKDLKKYKKEPMKYSGSYGDESEIYGVRVTYSEDGKYICYPTNVEVEDATLEFDLNFQKVGKEGAAIEIDDSVTRYQLLDNHKILYLKAGNDTLYLSDSKGNKEKIASDVYKFEIDKEEKNIVWVENSNGKSSLYQQDLKLKKEKKKLFKSADDYMIGDDLKQIVALDGDKLYLIKNFGEKEKISSDVSWVAENNEKDEVVYYTKQKEKKIDAMDLVEDDTNGDEDMEWLMEGLEDYQIETVDVSLYCYKDGKETEIAKKMGNFYTQHDSETVLFEKVNMEELPKIRASKLDGTYDVDEKYYEALRESAETCIYNGKEVVTLDVDMSTRSDEQTVLIDDEKNIGYILKSEMDKEGNIKGSELLSFKTGKNADGKCSVVAEDVDSMMGAKNGDIYYLTDMDDGMGDLYCNEEQIDSDVMRSTLSFTKEKENPVYMTDYNDSKNVFTLKMFNGKDAKEIADDVFDYKIVDEKKIVVLADYDDDDATGTLKLYRGKDKLVELDDDVTCLFGGMYN